MTIDTLMEIMTEALFTAFKMALPLLLVSVLVGLIIAVFQAATQVHEQTLTFVPKLIAIGLVLLILGPWMMEIAGDFFVNLFEFIAANV